MTYVRVTAIVTAFAALTAAGCARRTAPAVVAAPPPAVIPESPPAPPPPGEPAASVAAPALTEEEMFARMTLEELNASRPLGDVFFDLDRFSLRENGQAVLQQNAEWLRRWPSTRVYVEGHADSRGTTEYNLALGDRRAQAVRDYLVTLGLSEDRLRVVSKGEESPVCAEEYEECWRQNRRGHFVITAK